jgi:hypothetical protein
MSKNFQKLVYKGTFCGVVKKSSGLLLLDDLVLDREVDLVGTG